MKTSFRLHSFKNPKLLERALAHRSYGGASNERLEWLGDSVLSFHISRWIYRNFPRLGEGGMSAVRVRLICQDTLAKLAKEAGLDGQLRVGSGQKRDGKNILADAMEAYIAAVCLDGGDVDALLEDWLAEELEVVRMLIKQSGVSALRDAKSRLQEMLQKGGQPPPTYRLIKTSGKNASLLFSVECRASSAVAALATASTKNAAEQKAAADCLRQLASPSGDAG